VFLTFGKPRGQSRFARHELGEASHVGGCERLALFVEDTEQLGLDALELIEQRADLSFEVERRCVGRGGGGSHGYSKTSEVRSRRSEVKNDK